MSENGFEIVRSVTLSLLLGAWLFPAAPATGDRACGPGTSPLHPPIQLRGLNEPGAADHFRLAVPGGAVVALDLTVPIAETGKPLLGVLGADCSAPGFPPGVVGLERAPAHQLLFLPRPGCLCLRVGIRSRWRVEGARAVPYTLTATLARAPRQARGEDEAALRFTKETVEWEIEPDLAPLCDEVTDDHGDTVTCATPLALGSEVEGWLADGWGEDTDVFELVIEEPRTVTIAVRGPASALGALYTESGYRLGRGGGSSSGTFQLVEDLVPGRYYLQVEGHQGSGGPYAVRATASGW